MYTTSLDDVKLVIDLNKAINVVKLKAREYIKTELYRRWLEEKQAEYDEQYPEVDEEGNPIEYSNEKYLRDDNGDVILNDDWGPKLNPDYKPEFEEWLADNDYRFEIDENAEIDEEILASLREILYNYGKIYYFNILPAKGFDSPTLGIKVDCDRKALQDITYLIDDMEDNNETQTMFRKYDNNFIPVTLEQLKTLKSEIIKYGRSLYQKKWQWESNINNIKTIADIEGLKI